MKTSKTLFSTLSVATLAFAFSACNQNAANNNSAANVANKSNTAVVVNSNQPTANVNTNSNSTSNISTAGANKTPSAPTPNAKTNSETIEGELQMGKTESVILYFGEESGDYAGYCFANDSEAGRTISAKCKDKEQCEVVGEIDGEAACKVPGLEADLSASGKITKITSVKSLGRKK